MESGHQGEALRKLIRYSDYTQAEVAKRLNVTRATIHNWQQMGELPDYVVLKVAKLFNLPEDYFTANVPAEEVHDKEVIYLSKEKQAETLVLQRFV